MLNIVNSGQILLIVCAIGLAFISIFISARVKNPASFFKGVSLEGATPKLFTLVMSQVTTWIFARSLLNAAILGFYYGIWGTIAYAVYYLSFYTGAAIINSLRFTYGFNSVQDFLRDRFGRSGTWCYNFVIGLRLVSEVFANLLVIGLLFGVDGSSLYIIMIAVFAILTLIYSIFGGLYASLRTDVIQMLLLLIVLVLLTGMAFFSPNIDLSALGWKSFNIGDPGPVLIVVALLQIWSYPMHDPVMMDRGFLAGRAITMKSFLHAGWISIICIMVFGCFGVLAGAFANSGEDMNIVLLRIFGPALMLFFNLALIISAMSTLDSTLSSSAKLVAVDMRLIPSTVKNGRIVMALFMLLGLALVFGGDKNLFSAVAVSGTASMYLVPVIFFSLWGGSRSIPVWCYVGSFILALCGAVLYFTESSSYTVMLGSSHKYTKLLWISITVFMGGITLFSLGWLQCRVFQQKQLLDCKVS